MNPRWLPAAAAVAGIAAMVASSLAKPPVVPTPHMDVAPSRADRAVQPRLAPASVDTFVLADYRWGVPPGDPQGWTTVDLSVVPDTFFHVDDFAGMTGAWYTPISGSKSLWCGTRTRKGYPECGSSGCLPGYMNRWEQRFESIAFPRTGDVMVSFRVRWDSEPGYDATRLEYLDKDGWWIETLVLDGRGELPVTRVIPGTELPATVKLRLRFTSDPVWSDEDCLYPTDGAVIIDDLTVRDGTGIIDYQDFESELVGAQRTSDGDWQATHQPPYGNYAALYPGAAAIQEDQCRRSVSALWTFFVGSTRTYQCGSVFPNQKVIPYGNADGLYIYNEIWSPLLDWNQDAGGGAIPATASGALLAFDAYRDMPLDALMFYVWHVRAFDAQGCPGPWRDRNFVYYGSQKDWHRAVFEFGDLVPPGTVSVQVALGVRDMCYVWCGIYGGAPCHTHAPMFGSVSVRRVNLAGPRWSIQDIDQFQDNFAGDGTVTGTVRADMARDILSSSGPAVLPGDSAVVSVNDPGGGLADDPTLGGKRVYCYVSVQPPQGGKSGVSLSGGTRWPLAGMETINGITWTRLRLDQCVVSGNPVADRYCIDLNDGLFTPGDTVRFFYAADNTNGVRSFAHGDKLELQTSDVTEAAAAPAEFTCLPAGGWSRGGAILYVDGMDGRGAQPYWDTAFASLGLAEYVDRYDVRGPSGWLANDPGSRVTDVVAQLSACYRIILWDFGDLSVNLGGKSDAYGLLSAFLDNLGGPGGVYLCGDDAAQSIQSGNSFRTTYIPYVLRAANHRTTYGISPLVLGTPGGCFDGHSFHALGGCPILNDFDVVEPTAPSVMEASYGQPATNNGAVISKRTVNSNGVEVGVLLSGFSFIYIGDDDTDGIPDRVDHLQDILAWFSLAVPQPTGTASLPVNSLMQNYPNPFNPTTTIAFSLRQRASVSLVIYDVAGRRVRELANESLPAGSHTRVWDGTSAVGDHVASGVYFYRLVGPGFSSTKKMVLVK